MVPEETGQYPDNGAGNDKRYDAIDGVTVLEVFCRDQLAALPRGRRGLRAATHVLTAIPAACRLGWSDITVSAPELFRMLMHAGLITGSPTASDMPAALQLVASVCGLVTQRSARRWTVWFSRACDPDHPLGASIREAVTPAMLHRPESTSSTSTDSVPRTDPIRAERDQLAAELDGLKEELESLRSDHATIAAELTAARDEASARIREIEDLGLERDRLRETLTKAGERRLSLERELKSAQASARQAQSNLDKREKERAKLIKARHAMEEVLRVAQSKSRPVIDDLKKALAREQRQASALLAEKERLDARNAEQQSDLAQLREAARKCEQNLEFACSDLRRSSARNTVLDNALDGISDIFEIDRFDSLHPETFLDAVESAFSDAEAKADRIATACARSLYKSNIRLHNALAELVLHRAKKHSESDVQRFFEVHAQELLGQYIRSLMKMRAKLAAKGVNLPPPRVSQDDICPP